MLPVLGGGRRRPSFSTQATSVAEMLLLGGWINGLAFIPLALLQGQGRPDIVAKFHVLKVVPFIVVRWLLLHFYGLVGAAVAWTLRVTVDAGLLFSVARFRLSHAMRAPPALGFLASALVVTRSFEIASR